MENSMEKSQKIQNRTHDPAIPILGIYPEKVKTLNLKRYLHSCVHGSIIYSSQDETIKVSTDG